MGLAVAGLFLAFGLVWAGTPLVDLAALVFLIALLCSATPGALGSSATALGPVVLAARLAGFLPLLGLVIAGAGSAGAADSAAETLHFRTK